MTADLIRDPTELRRRLAERTLDVRTLDLAGFRRWLDLLLARWAADPVFAQRTRIRDVRRAHPELRALEAAHGQAADADAATPDGVRIAVLDKQLHNAERALDGITAALATSAPEARPALEAKREAFRARRQALEAERDQIELDSPHRQRLRQAADALRRAREAAGLDREEVRLAGLLRERGHGSGQAGQAFERAAVALVERVIRPAVGGAEGECRVLRSVRLGAAGVELDLVLVREPAADHDPVEVLAVAEAKRNLNDLAHGFLRRQLDLAWLTGDTAAYDPADHRTGRFPTGHFDRPAVHREDDRPFTFAPGSFRRFARDPAGGWLLDGLSFVTRAGPVWGLSGSALSRVAARVASDERWAPADPAYLARLFDWCRSLAGPVETPDVLDILTADAGRAARLLVTGV